MYVETFLKYLKYEKRYSVHTLVAYTTDLNQFRNFVQEQNLYQENVNIGFKTIRLWITNLLENKISKRSVSRKITTLKSYYKYLLKEGIIEVNPMAKISSPKIGKTIPLFVDESKLCNLLNDYDFGNDLQGIRNKLILEMFYATGLRRSELVNLELLNVDVNKQTIKVLGKRAKERIIPFSITLQNLIGDYLTCRNNIEIKTSKFFVTEKGKALYDKLVYRIVAKYLQLCSTIEKKSPHVLRHTFATHMLNHGAELNSIKELLGHSNLAATQIYTHSTFERLNKIYKQAHPRA